MPHRKEHHHGKQAGTAAAASGERADHRALPNQPKILELVVKCDSSGSLEAVAAAIPDLAPRGVEIRIIQAGIGDINKADIMQAETGSRLIVGFNVQLPHRLEQPAAERGVDVRLYSVIYRLLEEVKAIAARLLPSETEEEVLGTARVIRLFKSSRKGIILGLEVLAGELRVGRPFRIITAMGPVYAGRIESLRIEETPVTKATPGQQVGLKISDFKRVAVGDLVESTTMPSGR